MSLEISELNGSESKIKRKPWRELKQSELVERIRSLPEDEIVETSMRSYDSVVIPALMQIKFSLYGSRRKGQSAILYSNIHRGADLLTHSLKEKTEIINEANVKLFDYPVVEISEEVTREVTYLQFKNNRKKKLRLQQWVPESLGYVAECLNISTTGLYGMCLCFSLCEEGAVSEEYREVMALNVKRFRNKVDGRALKLKMLLNLTVDEEGNTRV